MLDTTFIVLVIRVTTGFEYCLKLAAGSKILANVDIPHKKRSIGYCGSNLREGCFSTVQLSRQSNLMTKFTERVHSIMENKAGFTHVGLDVTCHLSLAFCLSLDKQLLKLRMFERKLK